MPDRLVVMRRGAALESSLVSCAPEVGANLLTAATYMAGELRRYWAFAATLAAGTGVGPPHPAVQAVASEFAGRLPGFSLILGRSPGARLSELVPTLVAA
jgi:hypothetical protein